MSLTFLVRATFAAVLALTAAAAPAQKADRLHKQAPPGAERVQTFTPAPAIWRIADHDTVIYLFGTIHILRPTLKWRSRTLNRVIARADELVVESSDADFAALEGKLVAEMAADMEVKRPPLLDRVRPGKRAAVKRTIDESGFPAAMFDHLPTWMAVFALGMGGLPDDGATDEAGADATLERLFLKAGKPVLSVEDPDAVIAAVRAIPEADLLRLLEDEEAYAGDAANEDEAWARGDVSGLAEGLGEADLGPAVYAALIRDRNRAWTGWLIERMKRPGTVLFAVGAGHLVGPDSVQAMLAKRGVASPRIDR
ncbi:TraB/GumN family protein [Sphingomonas gilva]|uniref:TraB/GumN family protein n=1 Tax=Sphingomonas gilva TaxID=2305907 RepID=A0A396RPX6_9SPHN|nr:TraB/GumN family protein [Sphingomonas gilva]RHW17332.1 TraB/GumN family protein [Sphingomonas gilva]